MKAHPDRGAAPMRLLAACLFLVLSTTSALPGAWPRERGAGFASADARLSWPQDVAHRWHENAFQQYYTLYVEYGLTDRWTLGLDLGRSVSGDGKTVVFLQYPLRNRERGLQATAQLGFGKISGKAVLRPGLALGWELPKGWLSAESVAEIRTDSGLTDLKLDLTWGVTFDSGTKWIMQLQTGRPWASEEFARAATSVVVPLRGQLSVEAGVTWGLHTDENLGVKLGLWKEF